MKGMVIRLFELALQLNHPLSRVRERGRGEGTRLDQSAPSSVGLPHPAPRATFSRKREKARCFCE